MYLFPTLIAGLLLASAECVLGGSRLWEAKAPNKRTNPSPNYASIETLNTTSPLVRRALSIVDRSSDTSIPRIWPNRRVKYCFDDKNARIRGLWESAIETWAQLKDAGFTYEEVSDSKCRSERSSVLRIYYNSEGRLASTQGIPPVDTTANPPMLGPFTHLSDKEGIGQDNVQANVAHELGHVWGLVHEHQNPHYWKDDLGMSSLWNLAWIKGADIHFHTSGFKCENLKDHDTSRARVQAKIDAATKAGDKNLKGELETDLARLCVSAQAAGKHGFSASEWIPFAQTSNLEEDGNFDPDSLMMYPSGSGGHGLSNARSPVMVYKDGTLIPNRISPTAMDIDRIISLYGNSGSSSTGTPHTSKGSSWRARFKNVRSKLSRAGDTKDGVC
jgi:hypothetical protein